MRKMYKNVFDFCGRTENGITDVKADGAEFKTGQISEELAAHIEKEKTQFEAVEQKASMPCLVMIFKFILNLVWICILGGFLQACADGTSWKQMYQNVPTFFHVGIGAFAIWLLLCIVEMVKKNKVYENADLEGMVHRAKVIEEQIRLEFNIPEDAEHVDVLYQCYEMKKNKRKIIHALSYTFINQEMYVWRKDDVLCFCERSELYEIPVERFGEAELIKMAVQVSGWNKEEPINDEKYKAFKPYENGNDIYIKQHYALHVRGENEEFVIRIPNYDFATMQRLIGEGR